MAPLAGKAALGVDAVALDGVELVVDGSGSNAGESASILAGARGGKMSDDGVVVDSGGVLRIPPSSFPLRPVKTGVR